MSAQTPAAKWREKGEPDPHGTIYDCARATLALGDLTDDELANAAFMNYDRPLDIHAILNRKPGYHSPIVWMTAVKDRIRWLSRQMLKAKTERDELLILADEARHAHDTGCPVDWSEWDKVRAKYPPEGSANAERQS